MQIEMKWYIFLSVQQLRQIEKRDRTVEHFPDERPHPGLGLGGIVEAGDAAFLSPSCKYLPGRFAPSFLLVHCDV